MALHAILTAGGRLPGELRSLAASPVKALLDVNGRTLLETAACAVQGYPLVSRVAVAGGGEVMAALPPGTEYVREGKTVIDNILYAFRHLGGEEHNYVIVSPDLPFLTTDALHEFVERAREMCELGFPLVTRDDFLARFPGAPNRFTRIDGELVTLGSCVYITGPMLKSNIPLGRDFFNARKYPHKLAVMLGLPVAVAFLLGRLRLAAVEARARQLTGGEVRGVPVRDAAIAYDVDNRINYEYALKHQAQASSPSR